MLTTVQQYGDALLVPLRCCGRIARCCWRQCSSIMACFSTLLAGAAGGTRNCAGGVGRRPCSNNGLVLCHASEELRASYGDFALGGLSSQVESSETVPHRLEF